MGYLESGRIVDHATAGFTVSTSDDGRTVVTDILATSDAYRRGLRFEDEIVSLGGRPIRSANEFKNALGTYPRGWRVRLEYRQDGVRKATLIRLDGVHARQALLQLVEGASPPASEEAPPDTKRPIPKPIADVFARRSGFANYHFNAQHVDRILDPWRDAVGLAEAHGEWIIRGHDEQGRTFECVLRDDEAFLSWGDDTYRANLLGALEVEQAPPKSGGLLLTLSLWRRLLVLGPKEYGEVTYVGRVPNEGDESDLLDAVQAIHAVSESWLLFEPDTSELQKIEMNVDTRRDPCELFFSQTKDVGGRRLPHKWTIVHGDDVFAEWTVDDYTFSPPSP